MNDVNTLTLKAKIQVIYYQTNDDELGQAYATSDKRITIAESEQLLQDREILFKEVLKTKYEYRHIEIDVDDFEKSIIL